MITALVPTFNCETTIRACLESVKWVDRIFVVDSFSTDTTLDICREYTDWIVQHEYKYSAAQKNWAMEQITTEWVLQIDSDEELEATLSQEMQERIKNDPMTIEGYRMARKNLVWGKWVRCCDTYPDWQLRLFKTSKRRWSDRLVHAKVLGFEQIATLQNHIIHHDITDLSPELIQFSRQVVKWESNELVKHNRHWSWRDVTLRPGAIFLLMYFRKGGYREGVRGFYLSVYRAFYSFMTYTRLYELEVERGLHR